MDSGLWELASAWIEAGVTEDSSVVFLSDRGAGWKKAALVSESSLPLRHNLLFY